MGLTHNERQQLEFEVITNDARLRLTRLIRQSVGRDDQDVVIVRQNSVINIARNVLHLPLYVLEADDMGTFHTAEYGWHRGELEILFRRPNTVQLVETLADLIQQNWLEMDEVNEVLAEDRAAISFEEDGVERDVRVLIPSIEEIENEENDEHPNVRVLVRRMENGLEANDPASVLHASASVFETLAKDVVADSAVVDRSLGQFFDRYALDSNLPEPILHYIREVFRFRNREPLAGHGNVREPTITHEDAVILANLTKAILRIERQLALNTHDRNINDT